MVLLKDLFEKASKEHKVVRSKKKGAKQREFKTGFINTKRVYCQSCKQKYTYRYNYFDLKNEKYKSFSSVNLKSLKEKIKKNGLEWGVDSYYYARKTAKEVGLPLKDLK